MAEVQVYDGDGVMPPEMKQLIQENEKLRSRIALLEEEARNDDFVIQKVCEERDFLQEKLSAIHGIVIAKPKNEDFKPKNEYGDPKESMTNPSDLAHWGLDPTCHSLPTINPKWDYNHNS